MSASGSWSPPSLEHRRTGRQRTAHAAPRTAGRTVPRHTARRPSLRRTRTCRHGRCRTRSQRTPAASSPPQSSRPRTRRRTPDTRRGPSSGWGMCEGGKPLQSSPHRTRSAHGSTGHARSTEVSLGTQRRDPPRTRALPSPRCTRIGGWRRRRCRGPSSCGGRAAPRTSNRGPASRPRSGTRHQRTPRGRSSAPGRPQQSSPRQPTHCRTHTRPRSTRRVPSIPPRSRPGGTSPRALHQSPLPSAWSSRTHTSQDSTGSGP